MSEPGAEWAHLGLRDIVHAFLGGVANRIINEVLGINRVTYDITSKPRGRSN